VRTMAGGGGEARVAQLQKKKESIRERRFLQTKEKTKVKRGKGSAGKGKRCGNRRVLNVPVPD